MSGKISPTLTEDMSLARSGNIRMPDGTIQFVGTKKAYQMIDERERTNFYKNQSIDSDIVWKVKREDIPEEVDDKTSTEVLNETKGDILDAKHDELPEEPNGVSNKRDSIETQGGTERFFRGNIFITNQNRYTKSEHKHGADDSKSDAE